MLYFKKLQGSQGSANNRPAKFGVSQSLVEANCAIVKAPPITFLRPELLIGKLKPELISLSRNF